MNGIRTCTAVGILLGFFLLSPTGHSRPLEDWRPAYEYPHPDGIPPSVYQQRRQRALQHLGPRSALLVFAAEPRLRNGDVYYPYRQSSWLWYLTGVLEPNSVLVLSPQGIPWGERRLQELLFLPERAAARERWEGAQMGPMEAERLLDIPALPRAHYDSLLYLLLSQTDTLYVLAFPTPSLRLPISGEVISTEQLERERLRNRFSQLILRQGFPPLRRMRAEKDTAELRLLRRAIAITTAAFQRLWREAGPGIKEAELQALLEAEFRRHGADGPAFPTIVAAGGNACILHYTRGSRRIRDGELVLVDCGAEYAGYAADLTRTFPINGRFSPEQRLVYEAVLEAQDSALAACRPGVPFSTPHQRAVAVLKRRLSELGILRTPEELHRYFPHSTSHHLGLDVHDVGPIDTLRPGFVITVEPGVYIPPGSPCDQRWWNIGVRIEDVVLITPTGSEVLSSALPRRVEELEKLLRSSR
ncbi:MAG: aminopeptidase P family protein [Chlorobiota bacterium]